MIGSRRLRKVSPFDRLDRLKTRTRAALDRASRFDVETGLPKSRTADAIAEASKVDPATGRPESP